MSTTPESQSLTSTLERLKEANSVLSQLDPAIKAAAFEKLSPWIFLGRQHIPAERQMAGKAVPPGPSKDEGTPPMADTSSMGAFLGQFPNKKPSDNALSLAAWHYSQNGCDPIDVSQLKALAGQAGLTLPTNVYMTLSAASRNGKKLFQKTNGAFIPTVSGELAFQKEFGVKKGVKSQP
jgi:hypothetical protein